MAVDAKQFLTELAQQAGIAVTDLAPVLKVLDNPQLAKALGDSVERQSDYSRNMDRVKAAETALKNNQEEWKKWHDGNVAYVKELETKVGVTRTDPANPNPTVTSPADFEKKLKEATDRNLALSVNITKAALRVQDDYRSRFGKALDLDALEKFALDKNLTIENAYKEMIAPDIKVQEEAAQKKAIEDGIKAGVSAELSKHNLPIDTAAADAGGVSPFYAPRSDKPLGEGERARGFAETWNQNAGA